MAEFLKKKYENDNNIFTFDIKDVSTKKVTEFYDHSPFPNYKETDNKTTILDKGNRNILASQFKKFVGYKKKCFRSRMWNRTIIHFFFNGDQ